jgi:sugar porter (SP) family MFS transporter
LAAWPTEKLGRKKTLLFIGILYFLSAIGSADAPEVYSFMLARFIGGIGVGISTVAAPLYISEIAPAKDRGKLAGMFQFNIVFGILVALTSNYMLTGIGENAWRWMLGVEAIPALIYAVMCFGLPESPRWLITHGGNREAGVAVFRRIMPDATQEQLDQLAIEVSASVGHSTNFDEPTSKISSGDRSAVIHQNNLFTGSLKKPISLAFFIAFFNQLSGINAVLYFAPRIFEMTGLEQSAALLQSVGIGVTNLIFTFVGLWLIDRLGRRTLLVIGSFGYIASLGLCAWAFSTQTFGIVPACIFAFIAAHAVGQGAVIWVFISEIFPNQHRASGQAFGCFTHWIFAALLTLLFPKMVELFSPEMVFGFFTFMMVLQLVWVIVWVPETKGVPLEALQKKLAS